jgi:hypothetical protein
MVLEPIWRLPGYDDDIGLGKSDEKVIREYGSTFFDFPWG